MRSPKLIAAIVVGIAMAPITPDRASAADPWPQRAVNLVVPFGSGSGIDVAARVYAVSSPFAGSSRSLSSIGLGRKV